jgi:transcription elongation factor Elf1
MTPGEYIPDPTEGITRVEDLPPPQIHRRTRNVRSRRCPRCGHGASRYTTDTRTLHDLGDPRTGRPIDLIVAFSRHRCPSCGRCFAVDLTDLAHPKCLYTKRVQELAVRLVCEDGLSYQTASWHLWRDHRVFVPFATIQNWVEAAGGKKGGDTSDHLPRRRPDAVLRLLGHRRSL